MGGKSYVLQNSESAKGKKDLDHYAGKVRIQIVMENAHINFIGYWGR